MSHDDFHQQVPMDCRPAVYAASGELSFARPAVSRDIEAAVTDVLVQLSHALAAAGCTAIGHIKGTLSTADLGALSFHVTDLQRAPLLRGGFVSPVERAVLTLNVIVFGLREDLLTRLVTTALETGMERGVAWLRQ
jgi:hypothetical protein